MPSCAYMWRAGGQRVRQAGGAQSDGRWRHLPLRRARRRGCLVAMASLVTDFVHDTVHTLRGMNLRTLTQQLVSLGTFRAARAAARAAAHAGAQLLHAAPAGARGAGEAACTEREAPLLVALALTLTLFCRTRRPHRDVRAHYLEDAHGGHGQRVACACVRACVAPRVDA